MKSILVLGPGCRQCWKLKENAENAVRRAGVEASVEQITNMSAILAFDVLMTPALVIDGVVKAVGQVLSAEEIQALLVE